MHTKGEREERIRQEYSRSGLANTLGNVLSFQPPIHAPEPPPVVELPMNPVDEVLFLAGLGQVAVALLVEADNDLFEMVDLIIS